MSARIKSSTPRFVVVGEPKPEQRRLCSECTNGYVGTSGVHCEELNELILNETVAETCELFSGQ